jgi:hypothetical protein
MAFLLNWMLSGRWWRDIFQLLWAICRSTDNKGVDDELLDMVVGANPWFASVLLKQVTYERLGDPQWCALARALSDRHSVKVREG